MNSEEITEIRIPNNIDYKIIPSKEWEETEKQIKEVQQALELYRCLLDCFEKEEQKIQHIEMRLSPIELIDVIRINEKRLKDFFGVNEIYIEYGEKPNE